MSNLKLNGLIHNKFKSVSEFSRVCGWKIDKAYRIIRCEQDATVKDATEMAKTLNVPVSDVISIILPEMLPEANNILANQ